MKLPLLYSYALWIQDIRFPSSRPMEHNCNSSHKQLTLPTNNNNNFHNNTHFMTSTSLASSSSRPGPTGQCIPETIECLTFSKTVLLTAALTKDIGGLIQACKEVPVGCRY